LDEEDEQQVDVEEDEEDTEIQEMKAKFN